MLTFLRPLIERYFVLRERRTMVYILFVNPSNLTAIPDTDGTNGIGAACISDVVPSWFTSPSDGPRLAEHRGDPIET